MMMMVPLQQLEVSMPVLAHEPVIHPGGSQDVDYNKVSHIGVQTVVQVTVT